MGFDFHPRPPNTIYSGRQRFRAAGWKKTTDTVSDLAKKMAENPILAQLVICGPIWGSARDALTRSLYIIGLMVKMVNVSFF
jgi:hypothetical protein